jgi:hypothetical protein
MKPTDVVAIITAVVIVAVIIMAYIFVHAWKQRRAQQDAKQKAREEATQREAERQAQLAVEQAAKEEAGRKAQEDAERKVREEAAQREAKRQAQLAVEQAAKEEAERKAQEDAERKVREEAAQHEAERQAQLAAEQVAKEEAGRKAQEDAERKAREEAAQHEAERQAQLAVEQAAKDEVERKAQEDAERQAQLAAEQAAEDEAERKAQEDAEQKACEEAAQREAERQVQLAVEQVAKEEAERKAQEDAERKACEEAAQREAERQVQLAAEQAAKEEAERKAQEEAERNAEEAQQEAEGEQRPGAEVETKRLEPIKHGGRLPGGRKVEAWKPETSETKSRVLKPEVVCWKRALKWFVGIETPEEYEEYVGLTITQNGTQLTQDDEGRWVLLQITGTVCITWNGIEHPTEIGLEKPYLLFRLAGESINQGRRVRYATAGLFLVVVPDQWQRDEQISGPAPILPENVIIASCQAHYFFLDRKCAAQSVFIVPGSKSEIIPTRASRFELVGTRLPDASENMGPLFGEGPPSIRALDQNGWNSVKTIVVGQVEQEGWRTVFTPEPDCNKQSLPVELSERRGGWYFIRFYDAEDSLIESLDFRFVSGLKDIKISPYSPLPGINGHSPVRVEFLHDIGCAIELSNPPANNLSVECENARTIVTIPPDPIWDETCWMIRAEVQVEARILLERVRWAVVEGVGEESVEWTDMPLSTSRDLVTATSKHTIRFRLPRCRWASEIHVGFERWKARTYPVEVVKQEVTVPLSHFEGTQEIEDRGEEYSLKLWIGAANQGMPAVVAVIPATQPSITSVVQPPGSQRLQGDMCRVRKYLKRLGRRAQDPTLHKMIEEVRAQWFISVSAADSEPRQIETACVVALAWETFRADKVKLLGRHKRWIRKLVELALVHPETMQRVRENYDMLRRGHTSIISRTKR